MDTNQQSKGEIEIDLGAILELLINKIGIIMLSGILLAVVVVVGTLVFTTPKYQSVTKCYVLAKQNSDVVTSSDLQLSSLLVSDYAELIKSRTVTEAVIEKLHLNLNSEQLKKKIDVSSISGTRIISISVEDEDPQQAQLLADTVRDTAAEHIRSVMNIEAVNVVETANYPEHHSNLNILKNGVIGGFAGCFIMIIVLIMIHSCDDRIKTAEDVERCLKISTLGSIPISVDSIKKKKKRR